MPAAHARKQQKLTYGSAYRQLTAATDSPQLDGKPHASVGRSRDSDNNLGPATVFTTLCSRLTDAADESYQTRSRHRQQQQHGQLSLYSQGSVA